jgi:hypothetical protein
MEPRPRPSADQRNDDRAGELRRLQRVRLNVRASPTVAAAENWTTGENGSYLSFYVTIPGGTTLVEALRIVGNQIEFKAAQADQSKVDVSPSTGFSQTIANNCTTLLLKPSGTLASGTVVIAGGAGRWPDCTGAVVADDHIADRLAELRPIGRRRALDDRPVSAVLDDLRPR